MEQTTMGVKTAITNEQFERMAPSLGPCELIDGEIVPMAPAGDDHADINSNACFILKQFVKAHGLGRVLVGEAGMHTKKGYSRGADVAFISRKRKPQRSKGFLRIPPELVVEIKSDDTSWKKMQEKVDEYHEFGVDMVWVADPDSETLRVYPKNGGMFVIPKDGEIDGGNILPGFRVNIADFFAED
jgi:Uma2 family endonuclease